MALKNTYEIAAGEKPTAFIARLLAGEGATSVDTAVERSAIKALIPGNSGVAIYHAIRSGTVLAVDESDAAPLYLAPATEAPAADATPAAEAPKLGPAESVEVAAVAPWDSTIAAPDVLTHTSEPGITLKAAVSAVLYAAEAPLSAGEITRRLGGDTVADESDRKALARTVAMTANNLVLAGLAARVRREGDLTMVWSAVPEQIEALIACSQERDTTNAVWHHVRAGVRTVKALAEATGRNEPGVRASARSLQDNGWLSATREGTSVVYTAHDTPIAVADDAGEEVTGEEVTAPETTETAASESPVDTSDVPTAPAAAPPAGLFAGVESAFRQLPAGDARTQVLRALGDLFHALAAI